MCAFFVSVILSNTAFYIPSVVYSKTTHLKITLSSGVSVIDSVDEVMIDKLLTREYSVGKLGTVM